MRKTKNKNIEFNCITPMKGSIPEVKPASRYIPDWYKKMENDFGATEFNPQAMSIIKRHTMKRCLPIRDYMISGYVIPLQCDVLLRSELNNEHGFKYSLHTDTIVRGIDYHIPQQTKGSSLKDPVYKIISPWEIKTPAGYSCLFFSPYYCDTQGINIIPAIVDTDKHHMVNFPFTFTPSEKVKKEKVIPIGTPYVQVLPFKREAWEMKLGECTTETHDNGINKVKVMLKGAYDKLYRSKKVFR